MSLLAVFANPTDLLMFQIITPTTGTDPPNSSGLQPEGIRAGQSFRWRVSLKIMDKNKRGEMAI